MDKQNNTNKGISRRDFFRTSALLGGSCALASQLANASELKASSEHISSEDFYTLANAENIIYTVCQNCNTGCGIKAKIIDGVVVKIDGNPFSPWTMNSHIPYNNSPSNPEIARMDGAICPKGQAGIQTLYDPYRIRKVLKRDGKRGEGKWKSIPFEQAINEIVEGGKIFANVNGEENREVEGLNSICAMRDTELMKSMRSDVAEIINKKMTVDDFKEKYKDSLHLLIDPNHPDLGPKNNQLVFNWGRMKAGRSQFVQRFINGSFGTVNRHGHTTVCQGSLYFACKAMSEQYIDGKWTGGKKFYWQTDLKNAEFVIFVGSNAFEGGYGPPLRTSKITNGLTDRRLKFAVVDPRMGKLGAMAWKWIPAKPGSEAAMALAMIRWVIENKRYDERYLSCANKAASDAAGEPNWSNASWLVKIDNEGNPGDFLRAGDLSSVKGNSDDFVVFSNGSAKSVAPYDSENPVFGELFVDTQIAGIRVKSSLQLLFESSKENSIERWASICEVEPIVLIELAKEFTSHGKKASVDMHRGVSQHTNGYNNVAAWMCLNLLIGNVGWKGGLSQPSTYDATGGKTNQPYPISNLHPNKLNPFGYSIIRHETSYEKSTIFKGYPAKRPWFPLASDIYQEVIPSIGDQYPYPVKALILYMGAPNYALPAGDQLNAILSDLEKLPLFISNDITIGATSLYADYIFPDGTFLERWEFHGSHPNVTQRVQPARNPVITPLVETCTVFGNEMPITLESMLMGFAEKMNLSGFGVNGFGNGVDLTHPDNFYLKMVANIASDGTPVPDANDIEITTFLRARRHIKSYTFDEKRWRESAGEEWWKKVVYVLNRGGRFQDYKNTYKDEHLTNAYNTLVNMYCEKSARAINSRTGNNFSGIPKYEPVTDSLGKLIESAGFDLQLSTFRQSSQTKSRTNSAYWLLAVHPENFVLINSITATELGLKSGDTVRIISPSNNEGICKLGAFGNKDVVGKIKVIEGLKPGVVSFSLGYGQWGNGVHNMIIDGETIKGDERRGRGINANATMLVDPHLKNTTLSDLAGGSAVFYDTKVKLVKL